MVWRMVEDGGEWGSPLAGCSWLKACAGGGVGVCQHCNTSGLPMVASRRSSSCCWLIGGGGSAPSTALFGRQWASLAQARCSTHQPSVAMANKIPPDQGLRASKQNGEMPLLPAHNTMICWPSGIAGLTPRWAGGEPWYHFHRILSMGDPL